jgi:glycogen operon protein
VAVRERQKRNFVATLLLSQGVPMMAGGDELSRTQGGNNNAYCQDNEISWLRWDLSPQQGDFLAFCRALLALRREHPVFRRRQFFQGRPRRGAGVRDIEWLEPGGHPMTDQAWDAAFVRSLMVLLRGDQISETDREGLPIHDDTFLVLLNAHWGSVTFTLPPPGDDAIWERVLDTARPDWGRPNVRRSGRRIVASRSLVVFRRAVRPAAAHDHAGEPAAHARANGESAAAPAPEPVPQGAP